METRLRVINKWNDFLPIALKWGKYVYPYNAQPFYPVSIPYFSTREGEHIKKNYSRLKECIDN